MAPTQTLTNATLIDGSTVDVTIDRDGTIASITSTGSVVAADGLSPDHDVVDLNGLLLLAAPVEPHAHLDKAFLAEVVENPTGDLVGAVQAMRANQDKLVVADIVERSERAARWMAANGFVAVRTHADLNVGNGLTSVEALVELRDRVADVIDVQIVGLSGWPIVGALGADQRALTRAAIEAGVDVVGGCPHLEHLGGGDGTIEEATDAVFELAAEAGLPVDFHADETLDPTVNGLAHIARRVLDGFEMPVTASHCVSLDQMDEPVRRATIDAVAEAGVSIVTLPHTNLFLQGRDRSPMPRGLTAVAELIDAGVNVAAGADNLQDPFNPVGRACPFETAGLTIMASHRLPADAWHMVSAASAAVVGRSTGVEVGLAADLIAVEAQTVREAIANGQPPRHRWRAGARSSS